MTRKGFAVALLVLSGMPAPAHRLDEYLQGTLFSVAKNRLEAEITLTPGVIVFPFLIADIDTNADGTISESEQHAYAGRVLRDLSLSIDGRSLTPYLTSSAFPAIGEMKEGRGEIRIEFYADLPRGGPSRKLIFENRHQARIAAYQVNALVPRDPDIRVVRQNRNYSQSFYELEYVQAGASSGAPVMAFLAGGRGPLETIALVAVVLALVWGLRARGSFLSRHSHVIRY